MGAAPDAPARRAPDVGVIGEHQHHRVADGRPVEVADAVHHPRRAAHRQGLAAHDVAAGDEACKPAKVAVGAGHRLHECRAAAGRSPPPRTPDARARWRRDASASRPSRAPRHGPEAGPQAGVAEQPSALERPRYRA